MHSHRSAGKAGLCLFFSASLILAQAPTPANKPDRAGAYYHFSMAHLYEQLAREYRSTEYVTRSEERRVGKECRL